MEYKVLIKWDELGLSESQSQSPMEREKENQEIGKSPQSKATKTNSNDMLKQLQITTAIYGFGRQAGQMGVNYVSMNHQIRGESLKAERLQTKFSNTANNIGLGLGVGLSIATGNPIAIAMTAYGLAQRAYTLALDTQKYQAQLSNDRYKSSYYQSRLIKDISEVR